MEKKLMRDVVSSERRSIREISIDKTPKTRITETDKEGIKEKRMDFVPTGRDRKLPFFGLVIGVAIILLGLGVVFSGLFSGAVINIVPRYEMVEVNDDYRAVYSSEEDGELVYEIVILEKEESQLLASIGEEEVVSRASGVLIIFNDHSSEDQRLIANTRFESPEGLIYRISEAVTVPGQRTVNGATQPGSVEVVVHADEVGERYNIGLTDFTIPGFAGTAQFNSFSARSKTPMTGGAVGRVKTVDPGVENQARQKIRDELKKQIAEETLIGIPSNYVFLDAAFIVSFESLANLDQGEMVEIREKASLHAFVFDRLDLSRAIANQKFVNSGQPLDVEILNFSDIEFSFSNEVDPEQILAERRFDFNLRGRALVVWLYDGDSLKSSLAGKPKREINQVLFSYPNIQSATSVIRPFWKSSFPHDEGKIKINRQISLE